MEIPRYWRLRQQRYGLIGKICPSCKTKFFPPRDICPNCGKEVETPFTFSGHGEIYSFSTIYEAPTGFDEYTPYTVALIKLVEGPLITSQLTDMGEDLPEIGMQVEMVTRKLLQDGDERGLLVYGYKFRPVLKNSINMS
jgi:uncharacterized OB-fold protein